MSIECRPLGTLRAIETIITCLRRSKVVTPGEHIYEGEHELGMIRPDVNFLSMLQIVCPGHRRNDLIRIMQQDGWRRRPEGGWNLPERDTEPTPCLSCGGIDNMVEVLKAVETWIQEGPVRVGTRDTKELQLRVSRFLAEYGPEEEEY